MFCAPTVAAYACIVVYATSISLDWCTSISVPFTALSLVVVASCVQHVASTALLPCGDNLKHWTNQPPLATLLSHILRLFIAQMYELNGVAFVSLKCVVVSLSMISLTCVSAGKDTEVRTMSKFMNAMHC